MVNLGKCNIVFSVGMYKNVKNWFIGFLCFVSILLCIKYFIKIGIKVIVSVVEVVIVYVLVNVSGENILFFCVFSVNIGMKLMVMINKLKNSVGLILDVEFMMICYWFFFVRGVCFICLCIFLIMIMVLLFIVLIVIVIFFKDMMFVLIFCIYIMMIVVMILIGIFIIVISDECIWNKNVIYIRVMMINFFISLEVKLFIVCLIKVEWL